MGERLADHPAPSRRRAPARARARSPPRPARAASRSRRAARTAAPRRARPCGGWPAPGGPRAARRARRRAGPGCRRGRPRGRCPCRCRRRSRCRSWWRRRPRSANSRSVSRLIVTWRQAGSSGGSSVTWANRSRCHGGSWWWRIAGRPASTFAVALAAGRFSGIVHRFSTTTRSASASAASSSRVSRADRSCSPIGSSERSASIARPGTSRSTGPSPATVTTSNPNDASASAHDEATIETPSVRPRRKETRAQVGMARQAGGGGRAAGSG